MIGFRASPGDDVGLVDHDRHVASTARTSLRLGGSRRSRRPRSTSNRNPVCGLATFTRVQPSLARHSAPARACRGLSLRSPRAMAVALLDGDPTGRRRAAHLLARPQPKATSSSPRSACSLSEFPYSRAAPGSNPAQRLTTSCPRLTRRSPPSKIESSRLSMRGGLDKVDHAESAEPYCTHRRVTCVRSLSPAMTTRPTPFRLEGADLPPSFETPTTWNESQRSESDREPRS